MRKKILFILIFSITYLNALDTICKTNGEELKCKVVEIIDDEIKYKKGLESNATLETIPIFEVLFIKYANGEKDNFYRHNNSKATLLRKIKKSHKNFYLFGGYGSSWLDSKNSSESFSYENVPSFALGFGFNQQPFNYFGFHEEIMISKKGAEEKYESGDKWNYSDDIEIYYLDFPVLLTFKPIIHSQYFVPYLSLGGRISGCLSIVTEDYAFLDYGIITGAGLEINNYFILEFRYDVGQSNIYEENQHRWNQNIDCELRNKTLYGIIGVKF